MDKYVAFYMQGRADIEDDGISAEIDITAMATRVLDGEDLYKVTLEVADASIRPRENSSSKAKWQKQNAKDITDAGGDKEKAYVAFLNGQIAELRYTLEDETCDQMDELLDDSGDEPDEDDNGQSDDEADDILGDDE